ncbi:MAG: NAD(P)-binding domain-containing protein [Desulfobacteraceae bacterium]|nr:NAD(P)-binding domain-containing protein [Desulfobacteraceae bacterium]
MEEAKIVIIGGGPAGIATAVEAKEAGVSPVVILEKTDHACDTMVSLYHEGKRVDPVYRKIKIEPIGKMSFDTETREDFLARINGTIKEMGLDIRYKNEAQKVMRKDGGFRILTSGGLEIEAPVVVIAIGIFGRPAKPRYPIPADIKDKICFSLPKSSITGKKVLVVGGGDSAAETACYLSESNDVFLSYRRPEFFRLNAVNLENIKEITCKGLIKLMMGTDIEGLEKQGDEVLVRFKDGKNTAFDLVFYCLGGMTPKTFLESIGVEFSGERPLIDPSGETSIPGVFLAGDLMFEKGSIMAAFNSGKAVMDAITSRYKDLVK